MSTSPSDTTQEGNPGNLSPGPSRKKKRTLGTFPCAHCDKVFTRSDHLARHNLNHEPKEVFKCDFVIVEYGGNKRICGKTFVRKDLRERHTKRHLELMDTKVGPPPMKYDPRRKSSISSHNSSVGDESPTYTGGQSLSITNLIHGNENSMKKDINQNQNQTHSQPQNQNHIVEAPNSKLPAPQTQPLQQSQSVPLPSQTQPYLDVPPAQAQYYNNLQLAPQNYAQSQGPQNPVRSQSFHQGNGNQVQNSNGQNLSIPSQQYPQPADLYNKPLNFGNFIPQSQTDILSWLFTDSPPNQMKSSASEKSLQESNIPKSHDINTNDNLLHAKNLRQSSLADFPNNVVPSPYGGSQLSPTSEQIQQASTLINGPNFTKSPSDLMSIPQQFVPQLNTLPPQNSDESLTPFYNFHPSGQSNYGLQDVNIFSNDDNPLDEVFMKNYRASFNGAAGSGEFGAGLVKDFSSGITTPAGNVNLTSTASSNSPTNTNESNTSRKASIVFSPESVRHSSTVEPLESKLVNHGIKYNVAKNKHIFIDSLVIDSFARSLPDLTRAKINEVFQHDEQLYKYTIEDRLSYYLSMYWLVFHTQFTFLHKPSFDTKSSPPLLLLSMILMGCNYSSPTQSELLAKAGKKSPEFKFSMMIAIPLRYMIFQHDDFRSPVKLWVLQSLVILEWCEKNFLSRTMHERAHVHHGTTVQLLRRSPLLGGNPASATKKSSSASGSNTSAGEEDSDTVANELAAESKDDTSDYDLFVKWVEAESMKRITFMTFYIDVIDYIKFRHNPQITIYQLQLLNLPSDDEQLWESKEVNGSFRKIVKRQRKLQQQQQQQQQQQPSHPDPLRKKKEPVKIRGGTTFLNVLKKLLKPSQSSELQISTSKLSVFTRKILLAGLVSIMYQLQQTDVQNSSSLLTSNGIIQANGQRSKIWKEILTKAFDNWNAEIIEAYSTQVLSPNTSSIFNDISTSQVPIPMYHLSQVIGMSDINHYDVAIFGGSPANMSVEATLKDHYTVQRKLNNMWLKASHPNKRTINELINLRSVIHCYMLLWQLMLKPTDENVDGSIHYLDWNVNRDYFDSMYAVSISTLVLWCYAFSTCGMESNRYAELSGNDDSKDHSISARSYDELVQLSAEGGYQYLGRVRQEFLTNLRKDNLHKTFNIHPFRLNQAQKDKPSFSPHEILTKYCDILPHITNKQNLSGLCFLVGTKLLNSQWEVIRENAKLILNCGCRSIGKKDIICPDLFQGELED